jgi:hypothetical protein
MNELLQWLQLQSGSIRALIQFQQQALALRSAEPEHAALMRLLADLAARFVETYDGEPLPADVAERALARLIQFVEKAVRVRSASPSEQLALLNNIGLAELT